MSSSSQASGQNQTAFRPKSECSVAQRSLLSSGREPVFLDLDFEATGRPELITQLLALTEPSQPSTFGNNGVEESPLWNLSVATRLKRLLHIVRDTESISIFSLRLVCPHEDCRQSLEIELPLADLDALHDESADCELLRFPGADSRPLAFRRPTGNDLRHWRAVAPSPEDVLRTLLVPEETKAEPVNMPQPETCAVAFSEFDTLVAFQLTTHCPHCSRESAHSVDLETIALRRLSTLQQQLFRENHQLASAYGWSEADIFQVPRKRRLRYLTNLEDTA